MPKHVHADLIKAWADGAEIEYYDKRREVWRRTEIPTWLSDGQYRIKPKPPVVLAGIEVPRPDPKGTWCVVFDTMAWRYTTWPREGYELSAFRDAGLAHSTEENAQAHADALNAFHKQLLES